MTLLFKNYSLIEVMHLLIRSNKTKSLEQNAHTPHRERDNFKKGQQVLLSDTSHFLWKNSEPSAFWENLENSDLPLL